MSLKELLKKTEKELNAMRKDEIIDQLKKHGWYLNHYESQVETLTSKLALMQAPYDQAKQILIGATGVTVEKDEYSGRLKLENVDLCYLVGVLLAGKK